jgi:hypothetical protein
VFAFLLALAIGVAAASTGFAAPDSIFVSCRVFHDLNQDGLYQVNEPGLPNKKVTNGVQVFLTSAQGRVDIWVDRAKYRFATLTIPPGYWPTNSWYRWVPVGTSGPDSANFGLKTYTATASDPIRWVHITDTHAQALSYPWRMEDDLEEINELADPPLFLFNTGDLVAKQARLSVHDLWPFDFGTQDIGEG